MQGCLLKEQEIRNLINLGLGGLLKELKRRNEEKARMDALFSKNTPKDQAQEEDIIMQNKAMLEQKKTERNRKQSTNKIVPEEPSIEYQSSISMKKTSKSKWKRNIEEDVDLEWAI